MFEKLNEKDKKTATMGGVAVLAIVVLLVFYQGYSVKETKAKEYKSIDSDLKTLKMSDNEWTPQ